MKGNKMTLPSPQPKFMPYLSIIPNRRPEQKTHTNIGHAKNAVNDKLGYRGASCDMQIFEYRDNGWELLYDIKKGDLEPPWRKGELEEEARRKEAAASRVRQGVRKAAFDKGDAAFTREYGGTDGDVYEERIDFVAAFVAGYMEAWDERKGN